MDHTNISNTRCLFEIVSEDTLSYDSTFKFPLNHLIIHVYVKFNSSYFSFLGRLTHSSPPSASFLFISFGVMNFSIGVVKT